MKFLVGCFPEEDSNTITSSLTAGVTPLDPTMWPDSPVDPTVYGLLAKRKLPTEAIFSDERLTEPPHPPLTAVAPSEILWESEGEDMFKEEE